MSEVERLTYSVDEVCKALHLSRATLYGLWKAGAGPQFFHVGSRRLISRKAVDAYLASLEAKAASAAA
jgi:excisionase family DNA binding protein